MPPPHQLSTQADITALLRAASPHHGDKGRVGAPRLVQHPLRVPGRPPRLGRRLRRRRAVPQQPPQRLRPRPEVTDPQGRRRLLLVRLGAIHQDLLGAGAAGTAADLLKVLLLLLLGWSGMRHVARAPLAWVARVGTQRPGGPEGGVVRLPHACCAVEQRRRRRPRLATLRCQCGGTPLLCAPGPHCAAARAAAGLVRGPCNAIARLLALSSCTDVYVCEVALSPAAADEQCPT